jgi:hypothetical protein
MKRTVATVQGVYFLLTGLWPLIHVESFQAVTGRKTDNWTGHEADHWLLNTVSVLILAIAVPILVAAWRNSFSPAIIVLAIGSALVLTGIDLVYVSRGVTSKIYLADAAAEILLIILWIFSFWKKPSDQNPVSDSRTQWPFARKVCITRGDDNQAFGFPIRLDFPGGMRHHRDYGSGAFQPTAGRRIGSGVRQLFRLAIAANRIASTRFTSSRVRATNSP